MAKIKWLDRRIASPGPYLTLCLTEAEYFAALKSLGCQPIDDWIRNQHSDATVHFIEHSSGDRAVIVCVRVSGKRTGIEIAGLLVHEAVHIWQDYAERIGESKPGSEQEAYAIQSIAQELMAEYERRLS